MDLVEIKGLGTVLGRLEARGPSGISPPHCWFCGKIGSVWFGEGSTACDCVKSREAREGKRPKPWWNPRTNCIENLDAETIALNVALGYKVRVSAGVVPVRKAGGKPSEALSTGVVRVDSVDSVDSVSCPRPAQRGQFGAPAVDSVDSVDKLMARRAYKAENERRRRAKRRGE